MKTWLTPAAPSITSNINALSLTKELSGLAAFPLPEHSPWEAASFSQEAKIPHAIDFDFGQFHIVRIKDESPDSSNTRRVKRWYGGISVATTKPRYKGYLSNELTENSTSIPVGLRELISVFKNMVEQGMIVEARQTLQELSIHDLESSYGKVDTR